VAESRSLLRLLLMKLYLHFEYNPDGPGNHFDESENGFQGFLLSLRASDYRRENAQKAAVLATFCDKEEKKNAELNRPGKLVYPLTEPPNSPRTK
jgi:hypothetical protein